MYRSSAHNEELFLIWPKGVWGEWGWLFEDRPKCRRELGMPCVRKSPKVISGGPLQIPSNDGLCEAKVSSASLTIRLTDFVLFKTFGDILEIFGFSVWGWGCFDFTFHL